MPEKVRWGVMSTSGIGQVAVIPAIQKSKFGVVEALASRDIEKAGRVAHALGISRVVDSYEALLKDPDIDAVYIPLPNSMHAEWTIRAAEAGKSVLCEKPLATSSEDA
jgi:xylose dehydrogenase (NAD/NADP)